MSTPIRGTQEIVMPRLSDTMEEGTILRWLKADGETIARGEELVEIETDKATMVYESDQAGTLQLIAAEGDTLPVGRPIARVGEAPGADRSAPPAAVGAGDEGDQDEGVGVARAEAGDATGPQASAPAPAPAAAPWPAASEAQPVAGERIRASPLARRIARREGIDLAALRGSGPGGRIVKADVTSRPGGPPQEPPATPQPSPATRGPGDGAGAVSAPAATPEGVATAKGSTREVELSRLQQTIARRMAESKATIPDFSLQGDVEMDACVSLRQELKRLAGQGPAGEATPTYNDMVLKACALALREYPAANGSYRDGRLLLHSRINVGVAVAVEPQEGSPAGALVVPTVFDADEKSLGEISRETRALAGRVREATITPPELGGGTFTVSNLGMFGIRSFTAIINPPQAAIMAVGALEQRAVVARGGQGEEQIVSRHMLTLTLVCDHRILFGAEAARFLGRVRELLQTPASLTL